VKDCLNLGIPIIHQACHGVVKVRMGPRGLVLVREHRLRSIKAEQATLLEPLIQLWWDPRLPP